MIKIKHYIPRNHLLLLLLTRLAPGQRTGNQCVRQRTYQQIIPNRKKETPVPPMNFPNLPVQVLDRLYFYLVILHQSQQQRFKHLNHVQLP